MKKKIARFFEDTYYTLLTHLRNVLERLHILHNPLPSGIQFEITDKDVQEHLDLMETFEQIK
jgi:hypothetical protein